MKRCLTDCRLSGKSLTRPPSRRSGARAGVVILLILVTGALGPRLAHAASWQTVGKLAAGRTFHQATLLADGTVLLTGGQGADPTGVTGCAAQASAERFHPTTNAFTPLGSMRVQRQYHTAVRLLDGRVLVLGGEMGRCREPVLLASAELFDPATGMFASVANMTIGREGATATLLPDGRVLVVGGIEFSPGGNMVRVHATAELFDPATGTFQPAGALASPRTSHAAVGLPDGRVVILGGWGDHGQAIGRVEIYDPASGTFSAKGDLAQPRSDMTATLVPGGKIVVAGGTSGGPAQGNPTILASIEIYNPATGQSAITGTLASRRWLHVAVALADGRVLVASGTDRFNGAKLLRTADLVDPATGQVSPTEPMKFARWGAAAVLLPDGRALVTGGADAGNSAEVYIP
jgi:Kelch motif